MPTYEWASDLRQGHDLHAEPSAEHFIIKDGDDANDSSDSLDQQYETPKRSSEGLPVPPHSEDDVVWKTPDWHGH
eukprot:COSAG05_NODE_9672_length_608_cov_1.412574_1_plen_74_part_01